MPFDLAQGGPAWLELLTVVVVGLCIGSFLNVVIARLPERRSLWAPGSAWSN